MNIEEDSNAALRSNRWAFLWFNVGLFLTFSAYVSVLNLQSSINIEDGLGTISVAVSYTFCSIFMIFFTPILLRVFGLKKCLIGSELTYLIYVLANIYPEYYTLVPAAMIVGMGEAIMWPCVSLFNVYYALRYAEIRNHPSKDDDFYVNRYTGFFFTAQQCCQIFGNLITYAVLYGFSTETDVGEDHISTTIETITANTSIDRYQFCGAQDCQDEDIVGGSIDQYVPASRLAIIVLLSILVAICIIAQILHCYILPTNINRLKINEMTPETSDHDNPANEYDMNGSDLTTEKSEETTGRSNDSNRRTFWIQYTKALKDLLIQMKDTRQILLVPICLYVGFTQGFVFAELTRAYSSCVVGVAMVGLHMTTYGLSDAALSYIVAKLGYKWGRTPFFIVSMLIDAGCYCYCLFWNPNLDESWSIFLVFFGFGFSDGIWQTLSNVLYLEYFKSTHDVAMTMWTFWIIVGFAIQFAWSTSLCVYVKIYVQLLLLVFGMLCYGLAEQINRKRSSREILEETRL